MNLYSIYFTLIFIPFIALAQHYDPILTKAIAQTDTFFQKYVITDNYRWLEDIHSDETKEWIAQQTKNSKWFLSVATNKTNAFNLIQTYIHAEYENPQKAGKYYFTYAYHDDVSVPALFYQPSLTVEPKTLIDPVYLSRKDRIMICGYYISKDSKLLAYQFRRNGSDWMEVKVISMEDETEMKDHLTGIKFSHIAWLANGFFYSTFLQDEQFGETLGQRVFYHKIGTDQKEDKLIFGRKKNSSMLCHYLVTSDERFFVLKEENSDKGIVNIYYIDYQTDKPALKPLLINSTIGVKIIDSHDGKFIAVTTKGSNNGSIVEIDPTNPQQWRAITPNFSEALLLDVVPFANRIIATYQVNQHPIITAIDYSGTTLYSKTFPVATSVNGFSGNPNDDEVYFDFQSYTIPPVVYKFNIKTFDTELTKRTAVTFDYTKIEYKEVECSTSDSVAIPMILVYAKGIQLDGTNPTILEAYGGFGSVASPTFDPGIVYFIKHGGIYAFANIRGGGDKGVAWAQAGIGDNKQKSFDDFISAAEFLIRNNYTCKEKLAATGTSNGGLVVAAVAIQRPDLFKAVVPVVAPLDMLRLEKFTVGHWNTNEYGTVQDSASFTKLLAYSPYHRIAEETNYPSMLIITSENDDRVPPFHSYKFVAKMQNRSAQKNPILLKVEKRAGHHGAQTLYTDVQAMSDIYGFILNELTRK